LKRLIPLILILILGSFLRFYHLGEKSLWLDEAASQQTFIPMLKGIVANDAHPPLYNTLLYFWIRGGKKVSYPQSFSPRAITETRARSLSALLGILSIFLIYRTGRLFFGEKAGLLAALIMATSAYQVFYAQEARLETLVTLLIILSLYFFYRSLREKKRPLWVGFILSTTLSLYTFFYSFFILLGENIFFLSRFKKHRSSLKIFLVSQFIILFLFSPWFPVLRQRIALAESLPPAIHFSLLTSLLNIHTLFLDFTFGYARFAFPGWLISLTLLLFLSLTIYGLVAPSRPGTALFLSFWLFFPLFLALSFPLKVHLFQSKYLIFSAPAYYLLLSGGLVKLKSRKISVALLTLFILLNLVSLRLYYLKDFVKEDWRGAANYVEENSRNGDLVLFDPDYLGFAFDYYYSGNLTRAGIPAKGFSRAMPTLSAEYPRIWLIRDYGPVSPPSGNAQARLKEKYLLKNSKQFPGLNGRILLNLYVREN